MKTRIVSTPIGIEPILMNFTSQKNRTRNRVKAAEHIIMNLLIFLCVMLFHRKYAKIRYSRNVYIKLYSFRPIESFISEK